MSDDDKKDVHSRHDDRRQCSMCQREVPRGDGVYVGGGRWCCFPCAAVLYVDDDESEEDTKRGA